MSNLMFLCVEKSDEAVKFSALITTGNKCDYLHHFYYYVKDEPSQVYQVVHKIEHLQLKYNVDAFICSDAQLTVIKNIVGEEWVDFLYPISEFTECECLAGMSIDMLCGVLFGYSIHDDSAYAGSNAIKMCYKEIMKLKRKKKSIVSKVKFFYTKAAFEAAEEILECRDRNADFGELKDKLDYASELFKLTWRVLCK